MFFNSMRGDAQGLRNLMMRFPVIAVKDKDCAATIRQPVDRRLQFHQMLFRIKKHFRCAVIHSIKSKLFPRNLPDRLTASKIDCQIFRHTKQKSLGIFDAVDISDTAKFKIRILDHVLCFLPVSKLPGQKIKKRIMVDTVCVPNSAIPCFLNVIHAKAVSQRNPIRLDAQASVGSISKTE